MNINVKRIPYLLHNGLKVARLYKLDRGHLKESHLQFKPDFIQLLKALKQRDLLPNNVNEDDINGKDYTPYDIHDFFTLAQSFDELDLLIDVDLL